MTERWEIKINKLSGDKTRKAFCYLPKGYFESDRLYPVIYMFDGHNLFSDKEATFGKCWGLEEYLDKTETKVIIAAVECNTEGDSRLMEYSPVNFNFHGKPLKGKGKIYMDWLTREFKPFIDENFRTLPDRKNTAVAGSSMGGLMSVYALANYGKFFSKAAALSPSLWVGGENVLAFVEKAKFRKDTVLYLDYGSKEFVNHSVQKSVFIKTAEKLYTAGVNLTFRVILNGTHCEASWEKQIPVFMQTLGFLPEKS